MKRFVFVVALFASVQLVAGQESSPNIATPSLTPVTWERLVNAADEPHNWLMSVSYTHLTLPTILLV